MPVGVTDDEAILVVFSEPGPAVELKEFNGERFFRLHNFSRLKDI
jgi:hypothetical protein